MLRSRRADYLPSLRYASTLRIHCSGSLGLNVDDQSASIIDSPNLRPWTSFSSTGCVEDLLLDEQQIGPHPFCRQSSLATLNRRPASGSTDQFDRVGVLPSAVGEVSFHDQSCVIRWHRSTRCVPCRNRLLNRQPSGNPFRWPPPVIQHRTPRKVRSPLPVQTNAPDGNDDDEANVSFRIVNETPRQAVWAAAIAEWEWSIGMASPRGCEERRQWQPATFVVGRAA